MVGDGRDLLPSLPLPNPNPAVSFAPKIVSCPEKVLKEYLLKEWINYFIMRASKWSPTTVEIP